MTMTHRKAQCSPASHTSQPESVCGGQHQCAGTETHTDPQALDTACVHQKVQCTREIPRRKTQWRPSPVLSLQPPLHPLQGLEAQGRILSLRPLWEVCPIPPYNTMQLQWSNWVYLPEITLKTQPGLSLSVNPGGTGRFL